MLRVRWVGSWLFPYTYRRRQRTSSGDDTKRKWFYANIARVETPSPLVWEEILSMYTPPKHDKANMVWTENKRMVSAIQWMVISSYDICDGKRMVREVRIINDLSVTFIVMGKEVFTLKNEQEFTKEYIDNVFEFCLAVPLCKGFEVQDRLNTRDKQGVVIGKTEEWEMYDQLENTVKSLRHRSVNCSMMCSESETKCRHCENVRSNCHRKLNKKEHNAVGEQTCKKKKLSYMSPDEF